MEPGEPRDIVAQRIIDDKTLASLGVERPFGESFMSDDFTLAEATVFQEYVLPRLKRDLAKYLVDNLLDEWVNLRGDPFVFSFQIVKERIWGWCRTRYRLHVIVSRAIQHPVIFSNEPACVSMPWRFRTFWQEIKYRVRRWFQ
jgi:hypothetical protein